MKKRTIVRTALAFTGLALSLFLAMGGMAISTNFGVRTPGLRVAEAHARFSPKWEGLGEAMYTQVLIDWFCWFVLMLLIYLLVAKLWNWRKPKTLL